MWGIELSRAGAFAVGFHLAGFIPVTLMGLFYAWRTGLTLGEAAASEEVVEDVVEAVIPDQEKDRRRERGRDRERDRERERDRDRDRDRERDRPGGDGG
jgi:hypothetical protein